MVAAHTSPFGPNQIFRYLVAFIFFPALLSTSAHTQTGTVRGIVYGSEGVLYQATVTLANHAVLTNPQGAFTFSVLPGTYTLTVTHSGYQALAQQVTIEEGKTTLLQYLLVSAESMDEVVILGSRTMNRRSHLTTPVPVDVFSAKQLLQTGQVNLAQMLNFTVPSFNASRELLNEPVTLRGLDPQHVLILLNGTRFHNLAWYYAGALKGQLGRGSVGNDLNAIPFSAIEKLEILRDGAAAQYGADAIAGVINIRLKESTGTTSVHLHTGQYYQGDGEKFAFGINRGFTIRQKGFINLSADYRYQQPAYRGGEYMGTVYTPYPLSASRLDSLRIKAIDDSLVSARGFNRKSVQDNAGTVKTIRAGVLLNGGYAMNKTTELFWTAVVNDRRTRRDAVYRFPKNPGQVNLDLYPNGYQAESNAHTKDLAAIAGIKGKTKNNLHWSLTTTWGKNTLTNTTANNNNPSQSFMGKSAPTTFYNGKQVYRQQTSNIHVSKTGKPAFARSMNIAAGGEWRMERYRTEEGEEASWKNYDPTGTKQGGTGGISPADVVNKGRNVYAVYADLEAETDDRFLFSLAGRYEYYSDFGNNLAGKLAARYRFSKRFLLRASVNNGFRAPSLQQRYSSMTGIFIDRATGRPQFSGLYPNDHAVTKVLGIPSLTAEKTLNASGGMTLKLGRQSSLSADAYWIQVKNRVILSWSFNRRNRTIDSILAQDPNLSQITQLSFFSNAINTRTYGLDLVLNGVYHFRKSSMHYALAVNLNRTRLFGKIQAPRYIPATDSNTNILFNRADKATIEKGQPQDKIILQLKYQKGKLGLVLNNTRFGRTVAFHESRPSLDEFYSPKLLTDLAVSYKAGRWVTITVGANNVFDVYPDKLQHHENSAQGIFVYNPEATPFGFYGGYYFIGMNFSW